MTPSADSPTPHTVVTPRRRWLAATALVGAAGLTNGWVWYRQQAPSPSQPTPTTNDMPPDALWDQTFPTPSGGTLALAHFKGNPLLLNFWATWCPPCVKEMPLLNQFAKQMAPKGWHVIGLAVDQAPAVQKFLTHTPVQFDIAFAEANGLNLAFQLGNAAGGLPFSVVLDAAGRIRTRKIGPAHPEDLANWVNMINGS
jgi:thiol-disulfide isomerase/thioredoxin